MMLRPTSFAIVVAATAIAAVIFVPSSMVMAVSAAGMAAETAIENLDEDDRAQERAGMDESLEESVGAGDDISSDTTSSSTGPPTSTTACRWGDKDCHRKQEQKQRQTNTSGRSHGEKLRAKKSDDKYNNSVLAPPTHFNIAAHVRADPRHGISYFLDPDELRRSLAANVPFLECGAVGATTEGIPLVHGRFRHFPHCSSNVNVNVVAEAGETKNIDVDIGIEEMNVPKEDRYHQGGDIGRLSPPQYVVALSPLALTVGGNGNETRRFNPGDVIFIEDTAYYYDEDDYADDWEDKEEEERRSNDGSFLMRGHIMSAPPDSDEDLNVLVLTLPHSIYRHLRKGYNRPPEREAQVEEDLPFATADKSKREEEATTGKILQQRGDDETEERVKDTAFVAAAGLAGRARSRASRLWKRNAPLRFFSSSSASFDSGSAAVPKPCRLENDPAYSSFARDPKDLVRRTLYQTIAGILGGSAALALSVHLSRAVSVGTAVAWGGVCLVGLGTWGVVWSGELTLDELEMWGERRKYRRVLERRRRKERGDNGFDEDKSKILEDI